MDRVKALVLALGFDDTHTGEVVKRALHPGLLVRDAAGKRVRFYTVKQLRKLEDDATVVNGFAEALPPK